MRAGGKSSAIRCFMLVILVWKQLMVLVEMKESTRILAISKTHQLSINLSTFEMDSVNRKSVKLNNLLIVP